MAIKISEMIPDSDITGVELIPISDEGSPKSIDVDGVKDFTINAVEAIAPGTTITSSDSIFIKQGDKIKPLDVDKVVEYCIDEIWSKDAETSLALVDNLSLKKGSSEKIITLEDLAEFVRATIEAAILDVSDLSELSALIDVDMILVTHGTDGKKVSLSTLSTFIYASLKTYITALNEATVLNDTDFFYFIQGSTEKKMTMELLKAEIGGTVVGTGTADTVAEWSDSKTLKAGCTIVNSSTGFTVGTDTEIVTSKEIRINLNEKQDKVSSATENNIQTFDSAGNTKDSGVGLGTIIGGLIYQGAWDASSNTPTLASGTGTKGYFYIVSVAGSTNLDGTTDWGIGDFAVFNGSTWDKIDNTEAVTPSNVVTLTNKTIDGDNNTVTNIALIDTDSEFNATVHNNALLELATKTTIAGFDRMTPTTMPEPTWDNASRTAYFSIKTGSTDFCFWTNNKKHTKTVYEEIQIPNTTGEYYFFFDSSGVIQYVLKANMTYMHYCIYAICGFVYWNAETQVGFFNNDELHGKDMAGITHMEKHSTVGARYAKGLAINGLVHGNATYTGSDSGLSWDEDIPHNLASNTTGHAMLYRYGSAGAWRMLAPDLTLGHKESGDTYFSYNEELGGSWDWTEGGSTTDFFILLWAKTPNDIIKIAPQNAYSNRGNARDAIETEVHRIKMEGLPNAEICWLGATIVKRDGTLVQMADGSTFYDLTYLSGGGGSNSLATVAEDVITDTFTDRLALATQVQEALDILDGLGIPIASQSTKTADYSIVNADANVLVTLNATADKTFTLPTLIARNFYFLNDCEYDLTIQGALRSTDAVETGTTATNIVATAHAAVVGMLLIMTSGGEVDEVRPVTAIMDANNFTIDELSDAPSAGETYQLRDGINGKTKIQLGEGEQVSLRADSTKWLAK